MRQSDLVLEKYWVTQSVYFRLATIVELGRRIAYGKLLYCHGVAEGNVDKKIPTLEHNNRTVYDSFNNPFTANFGSPYFHIPPITTDDRPCLHKIARYTPDMLPYSISVAPKLS